MRIKCVYHTDFPSLNFRQDLAGVNEHVKDGDPSTSTADEILGYSIYQCKDSRCKT